MDWDKTTQTDTIATMCARGCIYAAWRRVDAPIIDADTIGEFYRDKPVHEWVAPCRKRSYGMERYNSDSGEWSRLDVAGCKCHKCEFDHGTAFRVDSTDKNGNVWCRIYYFAPNC